MIKNLYIDNSKLFLDDNFPDDETQVIVGPLQKRMFLCFKSDTYDGLELGFEEKKLIYKILVQGRPFACQKANLPNFHSRKTFSWQQGFEYSELETFDIFYI